MGDRYGVPPEKQSLFREINERVRQLEVATNSDTLRLICECAHAECADLVAVPRGDYDSLREVPNWFVVRPGHEDLTAEQVIRRDERYVVVGKLGSVRAPRES